MKHGTDIDDSLFESQYTLRTPMQRYNQLAELLSDNNNTHVNFVRFHALTKAAEPEVTQYGRRSLIASYYLFRKRLPEENTGLFDLEAANEALVNALLYNDWSINEPLFSMFDDRLEIISHEGLPAGLSHEEYLKGTCTP